jgi:hypothetical protein
VFFDDLEVFVGAGGIGQELYLVIDAASRAVRLRIIRGRPTG